VVTLKGGVFWIHFPGRSAYNELIMALGKSIDPDILRAALIGYQQERAEIAQKIDDITRQLGGKAGPSTGGGGRTRGMSAAGRRRIAAAQKKRWAALKKAAGAQGKKAAVKKSGKRKMSAEGRRRIAEATRKRWEAFRAKKAASKA
jgi:hypothetical protein